ncbi:MAG: CapA family protein [Candidatus Aminicenantes bacterium]|nr:CapA family protein [Candidatus Aminicenantes bacterium]
MSKLNFFGDVFLDKPQLANVPLEGEYIFNLESPLTRSAKPVWGKINLKSEAVHFKETFGKNPAAVCLANNHVMDYGKEGFLETVENLQKHGIQYFGAGRLVDNCHNPLVLELGGQRIALLGYVCPSTHPIFATAENFGVSSINLTAIAKDILRARAARAQRIIVQLHWGAEDVGLPKPTDVTLAHRIIDLGADLIIGHHAHCIQSFEIFKDKYIFYGLGNALFPNTEMVSYSREGLRENNRQIEWKKWNQRSLAVQFDYHSLAVDMRLLAFAKTLAVIPGARIDKLYGFKGRAGAPYQRHYARVLRLAMLRRLLTSFMSRPRIPKKENLRWIIQLFKTDKRQ